MNWKKVAHIFSADNNYQWMISHASVPLVLNIYENLVTIIFSTRNANNKSCIARLVYDINKLTIVSIDDKSLFQVDSIGNFDSDGVMASDVIRINNKVFVYYIGWNVCKNVPFRNAIGIAEYKDNQIIKIFDGPILDRSIYDPCFVASCCVIKIGDIFVMYYLSCVNWQKENNGFKHFYNIKIATSTDGFKWEREGKIAIDFKSNKEYAISTPRVIFDDGIYKMWYSYRGSKYSPNYRIGYAESCDGFTWIRNDIDFCLDVSINGWDNEMVCYPYVFKYNNSFYMLYNGNEYGKTGFGLAILN